MKLNFNKAQCFSMPEKLYLLVNTELEQVELPMANISTITLNFRDPYYSSRVWWLPPRRVSLSAPQARVAASLYYRLFFSRSPLP